MKLLEVDEVNGQLADLLHEARDHHEQILICENGAPLGIMFSTEDFAKWSEHGEMIEPSTLFADPEFQQKLRRSDEQLRDGQYLSHEEVLERFRKRCQKDA
ncbi:MAG: type II toxin-antitoxin system prevent-host-death family antitoxin [Armatimonadetes bacterium]|nr:type II toxin-antitoxin system prevent-host-death family antitoxin [Armatimonadota bacterium]